MHPIAFFPRTTSYPMLQTEQFYSQNAEQNMKDAVLKDFLEAWFSFNSFLKTTINPLHSSMYRVKLKNVWQMSATVQRINCMFFYPNPFSPVPVFFAFFFVDADDDNDVDGDIDSSSLTGESLESLLESSSSCSTVVIATVVKSTLIECVTTANRSRSSSSGPFSSTVPEYYPGARECSSEILRTGSRSVPYLFCELLRDRLGLGHR